MSLFTSNLVISKQRFLLPICHLFIKKCKLRTSLFLMESDYDGPIKIINENKKLSPSERAKNIKRIHFENTALFGPLLKTQKTRNTELEVGLVKIGSKANPISLSEEATITSNDTRGCPTLIDRDPNQSETKLLELDAEKLLGFPILNRFRSRNSSFLLNELEPETKAQIHVPSVTTVLNKTMPESSRIALEKWKQNMIKELGQEGFDFYQKSLLQNGKELHRNVHLKLNGEETEIKPVIANFWKSLDSVFPKITKVALLEQPVRHRFLRYHGIVDCVAVYRNTLIVIDWKTSKKLKSSLSHLYDSPLQVAAYVGAINFDPRFNFSLDSAAVILAYESGVPAHIHFLNKKLCLSYWNMWLFRLKMFKDAHKQY